MLQVAPGKPALLFFFETDCPTCRLTVHYLNRLYEVMPKGTATLVAISQDGDRATWNFKQRTGLRWPVYVDEGWAESRHYDPVAVPALYLLDRTGVVVRHQIGFDKHALNSLASELLGSNMVIASAFDGAPANKPGCTSRHREPAPEAEPIQSHVDVKRATRIALRDTVDPIDYCQHVGFADALPVIPPTA